MRAVEHGRVQGDGIHQVFLTHHVHQERLASGNIEGIHHTQQRRQDEDVPYLHLPAEGQARQCESQEQGCDLRRNHDPVPVVAVGYDAAQRCDEKYRNLAGEPY